MNRIVKLATAVAAAGSLGVAAGYSAQESPSPVAYLARLSRIGAALIQDSPAPIPASPQAETPKPVGLALDPLSNSGSKDDTLTNVTTPTITGIASAGADIKLLSHTAGIIGTGKANADGVWRVQVTKPFVHGTAHEIRATATVTGAIESGRSDIMQISIDTEAPQVPATLDLDNESDSPATRNTDNITNQNSPKLTVITTDAPAEVELFSDGKSLGKMKPKPASNNAWGLTVATPLTDGPHRITARATDTAGNVSKDSAPLAVTIDTTPPKVKSVNLSGTMGGPAVLEIRFEESDLEATSAQAAANFAIKRLAGTSTFAKGLDEGQMGAPSLASDSRTVQIFLSNLVTDRYELTLAPKAASNTNRLEDVAGNEVEEKRFQFSSLPGPVKGEMVHFPDFVEHSKPPEGFNPGDHVETRVARLYYFRDAHRVAEIINRNVQSLNRGLVERLRGEADAARKQADEATDTRRAQEREAIRKAEATRQTERQLREITVELNKVDADELNDIKFKTQVEAGKRDLDLAKSKAEKEAASAQTAFDTAETKVAAAQKALSEASEPDKPAKKIELEQSIRERDRAELALESKQQDLEAAKRELVTADRQLNEVKAKIDQLPARRAALKARQDALAQSIPAQRDAEVQARETMDKSQASEDRAKEEQFRREVALAHTDLNTYVPGDLKSIDPVGQVSVSVIGEGVIQLRGPIRGINKIRTMIDQIDTPVGQVKVGIFTVQVNGEHGDRMEKVAQRIEGNVDVSRFLTSQSMMLLRRAIQEVASEVAQQADRGGHHQIDRDRKYVYEFFGRDFADELFAMDSEFLKTGNNILSIHSMNTVSRSNALFVMAMAKNNIRQRILERFMQLIENDLPAAEYDFRKASRVLPCGRHTQREVFEKAQTLYRFRSFRGMFDVPLCDDANDTMTPMQREFLRLAQIFKSQMVAEVEWKQRVVERGLIEDRANDDARRAELLQPVHEEVLLRWRDAVAKLAAAQKAAAKAVGSYELTARSTGAVNDSQSAAVSAIDGAEPPVPDPRQRIQFAEKRIKQLTERIRKDAELFAMDGDNKAAAFKSMTTAANEIHRLLDEIVPTSPVLSDSTKREVQSARIEATRLYDVAAKSKTNESVTDYANYVRQQVEAISEDWNRWDKKRVQVQQYAQQALSAVSTKRPDRGASINEFVGSLASELDEDRRIDRQMKVAFEALAVQNDEAAEAKRELEKFEDSLRLTKGPLDHKKLLDFLIDEKEEKYIELREGTKSHIASMDNYLKRLAIALEDDFKVQFYDPAFCEVRKAAREWDVNLSEVERTTILTNNRQLAKVSPTATMEFDLPKRKILLQEALQGAKAAVEDYGALLQDPTFLAAAKMFSGSPTSSAASGPRGGVRGVGNQGHASGSMKNVLPGLPSDTDEQLMLQSGNQERELGAALEALIPDPAIYKFETGTGFEIRPVIQPDGDSIIYHFNYMYTTNVREPVRADEKHLGRVKRHFIDTEVQTSSYELREISRYQVALKASRTSRGVPLFEDIPGLGVLFRPQPSQESSLQQNIILGQSTIYPTLYDLMGLRWAPHVVSVDHKRLRDEQHVVEGRRQTISDFVFDHASERVDEFLGIKDGVDSKYDYLLRPDLYRQQSAPSPFHPGGYIEQRKQINDPTNNNFDVPDRRPPELRQPKYDSKHRSPIGEFDESCVIDIPLSLKKPPMTKSGIEQAGHEASASRAVSTKNAASSEKIPPGGKPPRDGLLNQLMRRIQE